MSAKTRTERRGRAALSNVLSKLGLKQYYPNKLTPQHFLELNKNNLFEQTVSSLEEIPWCFLRNLFKVNAECRNATQLTNCQEENDDLFDFDTDLYSADTKVNPLDLTVALFLCANPFLQQVIALKMAMCQFSVPLLLPFANQSQTSLMLWALRDIVKEWCPHDLSESKGFVEDNIVQAPIPFYSFVRLKNSTLSKSQFLNQVLSRGQQSHNIFLHRDMEGGAIKREIADGLVEVCWYLPSGRENLDIFPKPAAFANLRGDICESLVEFNFLFQVSNATFVFLDKVEKSEHDILMSLQDVKSKLFLIVNRKDGTAREDMVSVKATLKELDLPRSNVKCKDPSVNGAEFSRKLCEAIKTSLSGVRTTVPIESMQDKAVELGLSVDENKTDEQKNTAQEIIECIGVRKIPQYKKQHLPLQGEHWKRLSHLQKEECRLSFGDSGLEEIKCQLQDEQKAIKKDQRKQRVSKATKIFIKNVCTEDKEKRNAFLKWVKLKLDKYSREKLSTLRNSFKEEIKNKNIQRIAELDQALLDSSLGIEHYLRELGLIYEFSLEAAEIADEISALPGVAAEMLLDGYPLELLDGDASNIPERWVTDVLMELHRKVGQQSRLLVVTVLGVQSTGKSTLLNTMFGVEFPVSSGRCTRGAYMLFLKVGEDMKTELKCDFIVLIDTEGLKSPDLAQLQDSYEHDNQLATFVIGLSDVTIINFSMENSTEMKDVLQITAHAFLRMKRIGKKPVCHFVHQNVSGVSAHSKCMTERQRLLDQLNDMTQLAAEMEKQPSVKAFTDVMDYSIERNNWNIPGLWHGTPPMAPVNTGYSEAVAHFKTNLFKMVEEDKSYEAADVPVFLEWMRSLWKAVKYENFIFSFRNTLVAHAYDNLCKQYNEWEWEFKKEILSWQKGAELEILNADYESQVGTWNSLVESKKREALHKVAEQQTMMKQKLLDYYKRKDQHTNLIEKYKAVFVNSINCLAKEIQQSVISRLDHTLQQKVSTKKAHDVQRKYRSLIEKQVMKLLSNCKNSTLTDQELVREFEEMWNKITADISGLKERDIAGCVLKQLRRNFSNLNVSENLQNVNLQEMGKAPFKTRRDHMDSLKKRLVDWVMGDLQSFADNVIESCTQFISEKVKTNEDYHESFTNDLLQKIDAYLQTSRKKLKTNTQFEIDLKLHMCGIASRAFLEMHRKFLAKNDPKTQLEKHKSLYLSDFLDLYKNTDCGQRKAHDFATFCIKPAVDDYISRSLGIDIVDEILTSSQGVTYSSRHYFQYNIQKELLEREHFSSLVLYMSDYEHYVKNWIFEHICKKLSKDKSLCKLKTKNLQTIVKKILDATEKASKGKDGVLLPDTKQSITVLTSKMREYLIKDIMISVEAEKTTLFQIQSTCHVFAKSFKIALEELKKRLLHEYSQDVNIPETLIKLPIKPHEELFKRVFGCGKQCPFCEVPCEAGGKDHNQHHAAVHRPQGLARYYHQGTEKLVVTLCTTDVQSDRTFQNEDTNMEWHPYKEYTTYYPDWLIPPDRTIEASDYWKYVMAQYNKKLAKEYKAKPADVPKAWESISKEQAMKGLKAAFNIK